MFRKLIVVPLIIMSLVFAASGTAAAGGLTVYGPKIDAVVKPGADYSYTMKVENTSDGIMDIAVEVRGYGMSDDYDFVVLDPLADDSPYSGAKFLSVSPSSFSLAPGSSTEITVTATVPVGYKEGGAYAIVFIHTSATDSPTSTISGVAARVLFTIQGSRPVHDSTITSASLAKNETALLVTLQHNGNHHYKPHILLELTKEGNPAGSTSLEADWPLIPGYERQFMVSLGSLDLPAGEYDACVVVKDDEGNEVARWSSRLSLLLGSFATSGFARTSAAIASASSFGNSPSSTMPIPTAQTKDDAVGSEHPGASWLLIVAIAIGVLILWLAATALVTKWGRVRHG